METRQRERTPAMARAHADDDVKSTVSEYVRRPSAPLTVAMARALYSTGPFDQKTTRFIVNSTPLPPEDVYPVVEAAGRVAGKRDSERGYCRGAVIEAITASLVGERADALEEVSVGPLEGSWWTEGFSDPIDVVVLDEVLELYECKSITQEITSKHVHQFKLIGDLARAEGHQVHPVFVTLQRASVLADQLKGFREAPSPIYGATLETLHSMGRRLPDQAVR
jgi:hypothetical protein